MYEDSLQIGWTNAGSWGVTNTVQTTPTNKWGGYSFQAQFTQNWGGVEFHHDTSVDAGLRQYLSFRVRKEDVNGTIYVTGHRSDSTIGTWVDLRNYLVPGGYANFVASKWYSVRVPLATMDITVGTSLQGFIFQSSTPATAYFDDVVLQAGLSLGFPLSGLTPETVNINTVFDHSMTGTLANDTNLRITAWTGESGQNLSNDSPFKCTLKDVADQFGSIGSAFFLNGHYTGSACGGGVTYLSYQGHAGIDFQAAMDTPVYAAESGVIIGSSDLNGSLDCPSYTGPATPCTQGTTYGRMRIQHSNGYVTSYTHLHYQVGGLTLGAVINKGQQIGWSGNTSKTGESVGPHLHFALTIDSDLHSTAIDPYGWEGWYEDPYRSIQRPVFNSRQWQ